MKLNKLIQQTLLMIPLLSLSSTAKEPDFKKQDDILIKGNTWHYDVTLTIPSGVDFKPEFKVTGESNTQGTVYKFKEKQQSLGKSNVEEIGIELTKVNIYIADKLRKQQLLKIDDGALLYYGTYTIDPNDPKKKAGFVTKAPIPLHSDKAQVAEKWQWKQETIPLFQFRVISKDSEVSVKAGKFKADKIRMEQVDNASGKVLVSKEIWFTQGIGVIKEVEKQYIPDGKAIRKTLELTKQSIEPLK